MKSHDIGRALEIDKEINRLEVRLHELEETKTLRIEYGRNSFNPKDNTILKCIIRDDLRLKIADLKMEALNLGVTYE